MTALAVLPAEITPPDFGAALLPVLLASVTDSFVILDRSGCILWFNAGAEKLFGYSSGEMMGLDFAELVPLLVNMAQGGHRQFAGKRRDVIARHKDQSSFHISLSLNRGQMEDRRIFVAVMNAAAESRQIAKEPFQAMLDGVPDAVVTLDTSGLVESFSNSACALFGYRAADVIGQPLTMLMPSSYKEAHDNQVIRLRARDKGHFMNRGRVAIGQRRDGSAFPMEIAIGEAISDGQHLFVAYIRDVTERDGTEQRLEQLQSELLRVSRMDAMGHMTMAIAHELNQPLAAIANYINALKQSLGRKTPNAGMMQEFYGLIDKTTAEIQRAAAIVKGLRGFIDKRRITRQPADVGEVIEEALALTLIGPGAAGVRLKLELDASLPAVPMDRVQIQQVLFNLIHNSLEAMAPSASRVLTVTTEACNGFAEITVADSGPGLAPDIAARLFNPFVTSKENGMGVGLTICQTIVEAHGGRLWLVRSGESGAVFRFNLPLQAAEMP